ncbi:hypothetical protein I3842_01G197800 [Carya illinoinensis]|uniref:Uncharacterized protein n=1 Tax=Carya illinoinensis TaxID=32201 RepID=A0A922G5W8_CARIL|nr:hypothetical protein I3842_01G197800 [Carya illinoinensis]
MERDKNFCPPPSLSPHFLSLFFVFPPFAGLGPGREHLRSPFLYPILSNPCTKPWSVRKYQCSQTLIVSSIAQPSLSHPNRFPSQDMKTSMNKEDNG